MSSQFKEHCPICGAISLDGRPCEPRCEAGNLHHAGIDEPPIGVGLAVAGHGYDDRHNRGERFTGRGRRPSAHA